VKEASRKEVEASNFCWREIGTYVRIGVTGVTLGTIIDRKSLPPSSLVGKSDATSVKGPFPSQGVVIYLIVVKNYGCTVKKASKRNSMQGIYMGAKLGCT
jgi:hypothetical protein